MLQADPISFYLSPKIPCFCLPTLLTRISNEVQCKYLIYSEIIYEVLLLMKRA